MPDEDAESLCRSAGAQLLEFWHGAGFCAPDENEEAAEIRDLLDRAERAEPGTVTSALGLTVLALGLLRGHVAEELGLDNWEEDENEPYTELEPDDEAGRALADEVVRAARRVLELDPVDNLATFALGYALEWLGDTSAAAAAYREALRLDPSDEPAALRLEALRGGRAGSERGPAAGHAFGFHLLTMCHLVDHHGETEGRSWLLTELAEVRAAADGYVDEWVLGNDSLKDTCSLLTRVPGGEHQLLDLSAAVSATPAGQHVIDWSTVTLPGSLDLPLPCGQPIRLAGQLYFFGVNQHIEY